MDKTNAALGALTPASPPSDVMVERTTFRVFSVELREILERLAESIAEFTNRIERSFARHSTLPCRVSKYDDPHARAAFHRVRILLADARGLLETTVDSYALAWPIEREPLGCKRVARPKLSNTRVRPRRAGQLAEILGWMTPNEFDLYSSLGMRGAAVLEERSAVEGKRLGLIAFSDPENGAERVTACDEHAESDRNISNRYPLLVRDDLRHFQMAVPDAGLQDLKDLAQRVLAWRPILESNRQLDPNWSVLVHSYITVVHAELRPSRESRERQLQADDRRSPACGEQTPSPAEDPPMPPKPGGYTKAELIREVVDRGVALGATKFNDIRDRAGVKPRARGGKGAHQTFSNFEIRKLAKAAEAGTFRQGHQISAALLDLVASSDIGTKSNPNSGSRSRMKPDLNTRT